MTIVQFKTAANEITAAELLEEVNRLLGLASIAQKRIERIFRAGQNNLKAKYEMAPYRCEIQVINEQKRRVTRELILDENGSVAQDQPSDLHSAWRILYEYEKLSNNGINSYCQHQEAAKAHYLALGTLENELEFLGYSQAKAEEEIARSIALSADDQFCSTPIKTPADALVKFKELRTGYNDKIADSIEEYLRYLAA